MLVSPQSRQVEMRMETLIYVGVDAFQYTTNSCDALLSTLVKISMTPVLISRGLFENVTYLPANFKLQIINGIVSIKYCISSCRQLNPGISCILNANTFNTSYRVCIN